MNRSITALLLLGINCIAPYSVLATNIPTVLVGNIGNPHDPATGSKFGGVNYAYRIATTEVTNAQYVDFLNAKAAADPLGLYNTLMGSDPHGGISRIGVNGSFTYATRPNMGDKPVNLVSWFDAARFINWLHNGQGNGNTEAGAYTLLGGTPTPSNSNSIQRNAGALWYLPNDNEWYKAAYHQPAALGGDSDDYWAYPTRSNTEPVVATADFMGNINNPGSNIANYRKGADWNNQDGNVTTVGSAGQLSQSFYGTSDQAGNVEEWDEYLLGGLSAGLRGGSYSTSAVGLLARPILTVANPFDEGLVLGFRVAGIPSVPEPSTFAIAALGALGLLIATRRKRWCFCPERRVY